MFLRRARKEVLGQVRGKPCDAGYLPAHRMNAELAARGAPGRLRRAAASRTQAVRWSCARRARTPSRPPPGAPRNSAAHVGSSSRSARVRRLSPRRHAPCPLIHRVLPRQPQKSWKCGQFPERKMRQMCLGGACQDVSHPVDSFLHRARSASRSKPLPRAVGGSRRFTGEVDESATGSVNFWSNPF